MRHYFYIPALLMWIASSAMASPATTTKKVETEPFKCITTDGRVLYTTPGIGIAGSHCEDNRDLRIKKALPERIEKQAAPIPLLDLHAEKLKEQQARERIEAQQKEEDRLLKEKIAAEKKTESDKQAAKEKEEKIAADKKSENDKKNKENEATEPKKPSPLDFITPFLK